MNKILINILLFSTLVIGSIGLISFDVWADETTTDVYDIPEDYKSRNYYIEFYRQLSYDADGLTFEQYEYDFDIYVPSEYDSLFYFYQSCPSSWYVMCPFFYIYSDNSFAIAGINTNWAFDCNNTAKIELSLKNSDGSNTDDKIVIYIKNNGSTYHKITRKLSKTGVTESAYYESFITLSSLVRKNLSYGSKTQYLLKFNDAVVFHNGSNATPTMSADTYIFTTDKLSSLSDLLKNADYKIKTNKFEDMFLYVDKVRNQGQNNVFPEPELKSSRYNSDSNLIQLYYKRDNDNLPKLVDTYDKVFVKIQGNKDWITINNILDDTDSSCKVASVNNNIDQKLIIGVVNIDNLYSLLGYDYADSSQTPPVIEAIIWGVRYGYRLKSANYKYTNYVFSRYVFEDNVIVDTDITIDDLGNLTDIKQPSGGSSGVTVKPGGTSGNPVISATDEADYSDVGSFFKSLNFDFSSIGKALSGSFSLVTGFASMIGNVFSSFFGDAIGIIALLAIGICIVLRVLGR